MTITPPLVDQLESCQSRALGPLLQLGQTTICSPVHLGTQPCFREQVHHPIICKLSVVFQGPSVLSQLVWHKPAFPNDITSDILSRSPHREIPA